MRRDRHLWTEADRYRDPVRARRHPIRQFREHPLQPNQVHDSHDEQPMALRAVQGDRLTLQSTALGVRGAERLEEHHERSDVPRRGHRRSMHSLHRHRQHAHRRRTGAATGRRVS